MFCFGLVGEASTWIGWKATFFLRKIANFQDRRLHALTIRFVDSQVFLARRAESIEDARVPDGFDSVRNIAREIKGVAGRKFVRRSIDNQSHPAFENVHDLLLRMSMFRHFAAGFQSRDHLIHRFSAGQRLSFNAGANLDPGIFVWHSLSWVQLL